MNVVLVAVRAKAMRTKSTCKIPTSSPPGVSRVWDPQVKSLQCLAASKCDRADGASTLTSENVVCTVTVLTGLGGTAA